MIDEGGFSKSIILVVLYSVAWAFVFFLHRKKQKNAFGSGSFILLTYLLISISSVFLYMNEPNTFGELHLLQFIYLFALLYIGLSPVLSFERAKVSKIIPPPQIIINTFSILYILCTILSLPSAISHINEGIFTLLVDSSGGADLYNERLTNAKVQSEDYGISNVVSIFYNIFKDCASLVFFYYLTQPKGKKLLLFIFSFAIISSIFIALAEGNRGQATFAVLSICASYFLFRNLYNEKIKKIAKIAALSIGTITASFFIILTISRFGNMKDGAADSLLYYTGQAPLFFNKYAFSAGGVRYGDRTINLFKKIAGYDVPDGIFDTRIKYNYMAIGDENFTTYIGDFVLDFGPWITPVLVILFTLLIRKLTNSSNNSIHFYKLIPIYYVMNVCVNGGMCLFCYSFKSNLVIFAYIFFYVCCVTFKGNSRAS